MKIKLILLSLTLLISSQAFSIEAVNHYELAVTAHARGDDDEAYIHLKNATQLNSSHLPSKLLLGKIFFEVGNIQAAEKELLEAFHLGADINLVLPLLGSSLILQKKVSELLQFENKYYLLDQKNKFEWHLLRGQAYLINSKRDLADFEFREAIALFPNDSRAKNTLAALYVRLKYLEKAEVLVKESLELDKTNEKTWQLQGELLLAQGKSELALASFLEGHQLDPNDPKILRNLTSLYLEQSSIAEAMIYNEKIIEQSPYDPTANLIKAWFLKNQGNVEAADVILSSLSQRISVLDTSNESFDGNVNFVQGMAEYMLGNFEIAQNALLKHIEKYSMDVKSIKVLAEIYIRAKQIDEALKFLESHERVVTQNLELGKLLINLYFYKENIFRAEKTFNLLEQKFGKNPSLSITRAKLYDLQGYPELALAILNGVKPTSANFQYSLLKAKLLIQKGKLEQATIIAEELLKIDAGNPDTLNLLAAINIADEKLTKAEGFLTQVLDLQPTNITANFNLATIKKRQGNIDLAKSILKSSLSSKPAHAPTILQLAELESENGNFAEAEIWLNKLLAYNPSHKKANQELFNLYVYQKRWKDALSITSLLLLNDRLNAPLILQKALLLHELRNQDEAEKNFNLVYELWLSSAEKLKVLASYQFNSNDIKGAEKSLVKALELVPSDTDVLINLADVKLSIKDDVEVEKIIKTLKKAKVNSEAFLILQARFAQLQGQSANVLALYSKTLDLYPKSKPAILASYSLAQAGKHPELFVEHVQKLLEVEPDLLWCRKLLADYFLDSSIWDKAQLHYEHLLTTELYANSPTVLNNLANIYASSDLDKADRTIQLAIDHSTVKSASILDTKGWILAQQKNYSAALNFLREAYALNSKSNETHYHLGYVLFHLDRKEEAIKQLNEAVKLNNFPEYEDAVILLNNLK